ncbi:hypothetical protein INR49_032765, partial [Caranx melampygus]
MTWDSHHPPTSPHHELFTRARHGGETTHGSGISKQAGSEAARQAAARSLELQARSSVPARIIHSSLPSTDGKTERHRASRFRCINPRVSAWAPVSPRSDGRVVIITEKGRNEVLSAPLFLVCPAAVSHLHAAFDAPLLPPSLHLSIPSLSATAGCMFPLSLSLVLYLLHH